jgi:hypothetical protein
MPTVTLFLQKIPSTSGLAGDPYTTAVNPIRDTVFMGNQSAYDTWGTISVGAAGLFIPIGSELNAAKAAVRQIIVI